MINLLTCSDPCWRRGHRTACRRRWRPSWSCGHTWHPGRRCWGDLVLGLARPRSRWSLTPEPVDPHRLRSPSSPPRRPRSASTVNTRTYYGWCHSQGQSNFAATGAHSRLFSSTPNSGISMEKGIFYDGFLLGIKFEDYFILYNRIMNDEVHLITFTMRPCSKLHV